MSASLAGAVNIKNDGPHIIATNYWETAQAARGLCFCSINAGAVRLLVPRAFEHALDEMCTGREVLVTRAPWPAIGKDDALELLWEDGSDSPYALQLSPGQLDRLIARTDAGRQLACHVYTWGFAGAPTLAGSWPARFRIARSLPHLRPWGE